MVASPEYGVVITGLKSMIPARSGISVGKWPFIARWQVAYIR
jgi:hypothetical protein